MYKAKIEDQVFDFEFNNQTGLKGSVNGQTFEMDLKTQGSKHHVIHENQSYTIEIVNFNQKNKSFTLKVNNQEISVSVQDKYDQLLKRLGMENVNKVKINKVAAPMPGMVVQIIAQIGTQVKKGENLLILEAMKMENMIKSPADGRIKSIEISQGETVDKNQVLITFD